MAAAVEAPRCPYCPGQPAAVLRDGGDVYGAGYVGRFNLWVCSNFPDCDAYVGVHANSHSAAPRGTLANEALRKARIAVHAVFDPLWKSPSRVMTRSAAYRMLDGLMGVAKGHAHVGFFNEEECTRALDLLTKGKA